MDELYKIVAGSIAIMGFIIPLLMYLANRALKEIDSKVNKLFDICDETRKCLTDKAVQIAKLEEAIERLDKIAERCVK